LFGLKRHSTASAPTFCNLARFQQLEAAAAASLAGNISAMRPSNVGCKRVGRAAAIIEAWARDGGRTIKDPRNDEVIKNMDSPIERARDRRPSIPSPDTRHP
jgi:hypothetical protein